MKFFTSLVFALFAINTMADTPVAPAPASTPDTKVLIKTSEGDITLELDPKSAPITVANFLQYVDSGFYKDTLFHRVISSFMIQGGGMTAGMVEKSAREPIKNESANGLKNKRGTIAMARKQPPDSATSQFYINLLDNPNLDGSEITPGYTVFGKVITGMDVVDKIATIPTRRVGMFRDVPEKDIAILSTTRIK